MTPSYIFFSTLDEQPRLDVAIDGADEVDGNLDVVKGRGGALLREKMVELAAEKFVCIVDDSKMVSGLGGSKLAMPVEIVQVSVCSVGVHSGSCLVFFWKGRRVLHTGTCEARTQNSRRSSRSHPRA